MKTTSFLFFFLIIFLMAQAQEKYYDFSYGNKSLTSPYGLYAYNDTSFLMMMNTNDCRYPGNFHYLIRGIGHKLIQEDYTGIGNSDFIPLSNGNVAVLTADNICNSNPGINLFVYNNDLFTLYHIGNDTEFNAVNDIYQDTANINFSGAENSRQSLFFAEHGSRLLFRFHTGQITQVGRLSFHPVSMTALPNDDLMFVSDSAMVRTDSTGQIRWKNAAWAGVSKLRLLNDTTLLVMDNEALYLADTAGNKLRVYYAPAGRINDFSFSGTRIYASSVHGDTSYFVALDDGLHKIWQHSFTLGPIGAISVAPAGCMIAYTSLLGNASVLKTDTAGNYQLHPPFVKYDVTFERHDSVHSFYVNDCGNEFLYNDRIILHCHLKNISKETLESIALNINAPATCYNTTKDGLHLAPGDSTVFDIHVDDNVQVGSNYTFTIYPIAPNNRVDSSLRSTSFVLTIPASIRQAAYQQLAVFPNPAFSTLEIDQSPGGKAEIRDMTGKLVREFTASQGRDIVNVKDLKPGIYALRLKAAGDVYLTRFVKN